MHHSTSPTCTDDSAEYALCITVRSAPAGSSRGDRLRSSSQRGRFADCLVQSRAGGSTKTNPRRFCRTSLAGDRHRIFRWWRRSGGRRQRAAHVGGPPPAPSRRSFRGLGKRQAAQIIRSLGSVATRCKECALVSLQKLNPVGDVARVPDVTVICRILSRSRRKSKIPVFSPRISTRRRRSFSTAPARRRRPSPLPIRRWRKRRRVGLQPARMTPPAC
jgi:hypothetical protein